VCVNTTYAYTGSSWKSIYEVIFNEAYASLPQYTIDKTRFGPKNDDQKNELKKAAHRTLTIREDLYNFPDGQKLLQANGICFAGEWIIDQETAYTGVLANGSRYPVIIRASVSLNGTKYKDKRAFAMAIKVFPTEDRDASVETLNFFVMETIAGKRRQYFLQTVFDNAPNLGGIPAFSELGLALRLQSDFKAVDKELSPAEPDLAFRPISHLARTPDNSGKETTSPKWLRLSIAENISKQDIDDFRDELKLENYPSQQLIWDINVADEHVNGKSSATWQALGRIVLTESIESKPCDAQLHFAHPILEVEN
jgi:hypothetical protein